jgi:hypothetical protein
VISSGNKIFFRDNGKSKTIDLSPPTKGKGIDAYANEKWNVDTALQVYGANLPQDKKNEAYKKLGVDPNDMEYTYKANKNNSIKLQYILGQNLTHDQLLERMGTGRVVSVTGNQFTSNGVLDSLVEKGQLSKSEAKYLKSLKIDKDGNSLIKNSGGKNKKISIKTTTMPKIKIATTPGVQFSPTRSLSKASLQLPTKRQMIKIQLKKLNPKIELKRTTKRV